MRSLTFLNMAVFVPLYLLRNRNIERRPAESGENIMLRLRLNELQFQDLLDGYHEWRQRGKQIILR